MTLSPQIPASAGSNSNPVRCDADSRQADDLILSYFPLVKATAARIREMLPENCGLELADLVQAGYIGLIQAAQAYDAASGVSFAFYARYRIRGEILDTLRDMDTLSRRFRRWKKLVDSVTADLTGRLNREPTEAEILEGCGAQSSGTWGKNMSLLAHGLLSQDQLRHEPFSSADTHPDAICSHRQVQSILRDVLGSLPQRAQKLLSLYYQDDLTMREIAALLHVNESRVSQMHKRALRTVAKRLRSSGIRRSADLRATA